MFALALTAALLTTPPPPTIVVVTVTEGYRHESIEKAEEVIAAIATRTGAFVPRFVRTPQELPPDLAQARVVMFVNTTGELKWPERQQLLDWIAGGGSFIGVHSASDTWHEWPAYIEMLGGEFESHPPEMQADVVVVDPKHPATAGLISPHSLFEEYYQLKNFAPDRVNLVLSLAGGSPMAWYRSHGLGRVFYTALGHREDVWSSSWFQQHLTGAIIWALGYEPGPRRRAIRR